LTYRVLTARKVREHLEGAPPELRGYAFVLLGGPDYKTIVFAQGRGFLDCHIVEAQRVVVLVGLTWL
jgi:hypothetical protein